MSASVALVAMAPDRYRVWFDRSRREYASEHVASGNWTQEESLDRARAQFATFLPQGLATPGSEVWTIIDEAGADVGVLCVAPRAWRLGYVETNVNMEKRL